MMKTVLIRWTVNVVAIWVLYQFGNGFNPIDSSTITFIVNGLILTVVDAVIRPLFKLITCPLIMITLGLGNFLINICMFLLSGWIGLEIGYGFSIDGLGVERIENVFLLSLMLVVTRFVINLILKIITKYK